MPEGPSIVIAKEQISPFIGKRIIAVGGNSKTDIKRMENRDLLDVKTWGKHLLLCFDEFTFRIHFLLFGSYRINEVKNVPLRLGLVFSGGELNFYNTSIKTLEGDINLHYDWSADVMNIKWDAAVALDKLHSISGTLICDALLEQDIFSGVGNIIKNEILYRVHVHPESIVGKIPDKKLKEIITQARQYSFEFLEYKKANVLKKQWLAHTKRICLRCDLPLYKKYTGNKKRRSFYCLNCQYLYI
ncbi:MAG TPA: endonuclease [Sphingobacterium sp.]|nr:endonuclease [Sphingobacterium sp.]